MSELLVNTIINADNNGPPNFPFGATGINTATSSEYADVAGIATVAEGLTGTPDIVVGNITAVDGTFSGNVSIAGTLTYQDVTDVNAVGVITATQGIDVTGRDINITSGGLNAAGVITATSFVGDVTGNAGGLSGTPNITVNNVVGATLNVEDKTIGIASVSSPSDTTANGGGIQIYGSTTKEFVFSNSKQSFESNIPLASDEIRFVTGAEKSTRIDGNTANLVYSSNSSNVAICTNPDGNITLNVTGIPETSDFDDHTLTFTVLSNASAGTAYSCLTVTMNGVSKTINWAGGDSQTATAGLTTTSGYTIYSFSSINPIGSASSCANYVVLGTVSGGYF